MIKDMTKVEFSDELRSRTIDFCKDELYYHISDCDRADEYDGENLAEIELLYRLGEKKLAKNYKDDYNDALSALIEECENEEEKKELKAKQQALGYFFDNLTILD